MQDIGFDIISDLYLSPGEIFNWEGKVTSLYCLVAGNVSADLKTIIQTLSHLGKFYQGVFYIPGTLEYENSYNVAIRTDELITITKYLPNVCMLHKHVVIIDGVAIVGINGWNTVGNTLTLENLLAAASRHEDITYLHKTITKLQKHLDIKKIIVVTNGVPHESLYFGETPVIVDDQIPLHATLTGDTEHKVTHWVFGSYDKSADNMINDVTYINNPYMKKSIYWAKRITVSV